MEKYIYGNVSPDDEGRVAEGKGLSVKDAKLASKQIQKDSIMKGEKLFQAEFSAEKKAYLLQEKQAKIADFQKRMEMITQSGSETRKQLQANLVEEVQMHLEELQGIKDEEIVKVKNKLQSILEYVQGL